MAGIAIVILLTATSTMLVESRNISPRSRDCGGSLYINSFVKFFAVPNNLNPLSRFSTIQIIVIS